VTKTETSCACSEVYAGSEPTGSFNWNPDCLVHGTESKWWNSTAQVAQRRKDDERLRLIQTKARFARQLGVGCHGRPIEELEPEGDCQVCDLTRSALER
jgi:hypothetical protein